jgi:hypothetical protein
LDALIGVTDLARSRRIRSLAASGDTSAGLEPGARGLGGIETRLAGVVVAALKEAFERDTRRLELEREQLEAERRRAERALQLEMLRQAAEREIGRLRAIAGVAVLTWLGSLFFAARVLGAGVAARVTLGFGWLLLLAAIAASFSGQSSVSGAVPVGADDGWSAKGSLERMSSGVAGAFALWLTVVGLALVAVAVLL